MKQKSLLVEGLSDAVGFLGGAMLGLWAGRLMGMDLTADGYGSSVMGGILLVGIGGGLGLQLARRWRTARAKGKQSTQED